MLRTAAVLMLLLLLAASAGAQQPGSAARKQAKENQNTATGPLTISGCLRSDRGRYTLLQQQPAQAFVVNGDAAELSRATGHQVRVEATELPPQARRPPNDLPRLQVSRIDVLANECANNIGLPAHGVAASPSPQRGTVQESSPYSNPGAMGTSSAPVGPGTGQNVNSRAEGAPSPGSGDPRNLSPSPQGVPVNPPETDTTKQKSGENKSKQKDEEKAVPPQ